MEKTTPWFHGKTKPARRGVYQQMCGHGVSLGYQYWNGAVWFGWRATPREAFEERKNTPARTQEDKWRGLMKKTPNSK